MTISTTAVRQVFACSSGTTYAFTLPFNTDAELKVILVTNADGTESDLTANLNSGSAGGWSVTSHTANSTGIAYSGGTITTISTYTSSYSLVVISEPLLTQTVDLVSGDALPVATIETQLDKLALAIQRLDDRIDRAVTYTDGYNANVAVDPTYSTDAVNVNVQVADGSITADKLASDVPFTDIGEPAAQAYALNTTLTFAHTLGVVPKMIFAYMKCTDAGGDAGYEQNDYIVIAPSVDVDGASDWGITMSMDATNVYLNINVNGYSVMNEGAHNNIDTLAAGKWDIYIKAYA